jgi:hypothetical protein
MSEVIDFEALSGAEMHNIPYPWACYERAFTDPEALVCQFPTDGYAPHSQQKLLETLGKKGSSAWYQHNVRTRALLELGQTEPHDKHELADVWLAVAQDLLSKEYRERLTKLTGHDVRELPMQAHFWRFYGGAFFQPHIDKSHKIVTHLMYLTPEWSPEMGGCFRVLGSNDPEDVHTEIAPTSNVSIVLRRTDNAWHCVSRIPRETQQTRTLLQVWFWK